jgi:BRO1 domain-containing protein BROX, putative
MKKASALAGKEELREDEAKKLHRYLRKAAGIFQNVREKQLPKLAEKSISCSDLDEQIMKCYFLQCCAEAQEGK